MIIIMQEKRVSEMEVEAFVGDDEGIWILNGSFHLLLCTASWICAPVITSVYVQLKKKKNRFKLILVIFNKQKNE